MEFDYWTPKTGMLESDTLGSEPTKKKWNKNIAKKNVTTIDRAMGQQNGSEVRSVKLNGFIYKTKFCLTSLLCKVSPSKYFFKPLLGLVWRRPNRFCKMFAPVLLQNATRHAWQKLSGKIVASRRVPKKPPPTKCQSHICVFLKGTLNRDSLNLGGIGYRTEKNRN